MLIRKVSDSKWIKMELKIRMIVLFLTLSLLFFINVFIGCTGSLLMCALSLVTESGVGGVLLSCGAWLLLRSTGSGCAGSMVVVHGLNCSVACAVFPDQGLIPCLLHWQADSYPLYHQGSPLKLALILKRLTPLLSVYSSPAFHV